jgi:hypothetical protein
MKVKLLLCFALLAGLLTVCAQMFAHHGSASYSDKLLVLKDATVTKFVWANPHSIVMFDVKDDNGNVVHWAGEAGSPSALGLIGWSKNSVQRGDVIAVYMYPAKSGNPVGRLSRIVLSDGSTLRDSQQGGEKYNPGGGQPKE